MRLGWSIQAGAWLKLPHSMTASDIKKLSWSTKTKLKEVIEKEEEKLVKRPPSFTNTNLSFKSCKTYSTDGHGPKRTEAGFSTVDKDKAKCRPNSTLTEAKDVFDSDRKRTDPLVGDAVVQKQRLPVSLFIPNDFMNRNTTARAALFDKPGNLPLDSTSVTSPTKFDMHERKKMTDKAKSGNVEVKFVCDANNRKEGKKRSACTPNKKQSTRACAETSVLNRKSTSRDAKLDLKLHPKTQPTCKITAHMKYCRDVFPQQTVESVYNLVTDQMHFKSRNVTFGTNFPTEDPVRFPIQSALQTTYKSIGSTKELHKLLTHNSLKPRKQLCCNNYTIQLEKEVDRSMFPSIFVIP